MFEHRFVAGWGDMDFNGHMRNTAYLDRGSDSRMLFFAAIERLGRSADYAQLPSSLRNTSA